MASTSFEPTKLNYIQPSYLVSQSQTDFSTTVQSKRPANWPFRPAVQPWVFDPLLHGLPTPPATNSTGPQTTRLGPGSVSGHQVKVLHLQCGRRQVSTWVGFRRWIRAFRGLPYTHVHFQLAIQLLLTCNLLLSCSSHAICYSVVYYATTPPMKHPIWIQ